VTWKPRRLMTGRMCHFAAVYSFFALRYNTIAEFNVDYKAECGQLNLAHATRNKQKLKQTNASVHLLQYRLKIREGSPKGTRKTMEERICETNEL